MDQRIAADRATRPLGDVVGEALTARVTVDEGGAVTGWNAGAEQLLGYSAAQILGRPAADLLAEAIPRRIRHLSRTCRDGTGRSLSGTTTADASRSRSWLTTGHRRPAPASGSWSPH
jgi:PAS domain S-box-containing protein